MSVSRRGFLEYSKLFAAASLFPRSLLHLSFPNKIAKDGTTFLNNMTRDSIAPYVKSTWKVRSTTGASTYLTLLAVKDASVTAGADTQAMTAAPENLGRQQAGVDTFALEFLGIGDALPQGTYELEHNQIGVFSLFIVPAESPIYVAMISHLLAGNTKVNPPVKTPKLQRGIQKKNALSDQ